MNRKKSSFEKFLEKISSATDRFAGVICAVMFGAMTLTVLLGVLFRYVLRAPLSWPEEASRYLMIWGASVGISLGIRSEEHVGLTVIMDSIRSRPLRLIFQTFIFLVVLGFIGIMFYYSLSMTRDGRFMQMQSFGMSMYLAFAAVPVAMILAAVQLVLKYALKIAGGDDKPRGNVIVDI